MQNICRIFLCFVSCAFIQLVHVLQHTLRKLVECVEYIEKKMCSDFKEHDFI